MPDLREVLAALGSLKAYFWGLIDEKTFQKQTNMNLFYLLLMESEFEPLRKKEVGLEVKSGVELKWNAQSVIWVSYRGTETHWHGMKAENQTSDWSTLNWLETQLRYKPLIQ